MCASFDQPATMIYIALKITEFTLDSRTLYTLAYDNLETSLWYKRNISKISVILGRCWSNIEGEFENFVRAHF